MRTIREIINTPLNLYTDHKNFNKLDNRRTNLRICTKRENQIHQFNSRNTSGIRGVSWSKYANSWVVQFSPRKGIYKRFYFKDKEIAIKNYNKFVIKYYGNFAILAR